jgi:hypothetical protein
LAGWNNGALEFELSSAATVTASVYGMDGRVKLRLERNLSGGSHSWPLSELSNGTSFIEFSSPEGKTFFKATRVEGAMTSTAVSRVGPSALAAAKTSAGVALYDEIVVGKAGFLKHYRPVSSSVETGIEIVMQPEATPHFSFFIVSMKAIIAHSGSQDGFGGDLRFGETGPGAGLRGADKICRTVAEGSMPGAGSRGWRAFLSATTDANGKQVDAINRVGPGPWYDRLERVMAPTKADLIDVRPKNGDPAIQLDLPNEDGVPNKKPDPSQTQYDDNHHMLTGSSETGTLKSANSTCKDWTVAEANSAHGKPGVGFAWPRGGRVSNQGSHWMSTYDSPGCGKGISIVEDGPGKPNILTVGEGGGYGGFYCFALTP